MALHLAKTKSIQDTSNKYILKVAIVLKGKKGKNIESFYFRHTNWFKVTQHPHAYSLDLRS